MATCCEIVPTGIRCNPSMYFDINTNSIASNTSSITSNIADITSLNTSIQASTITGTIKVANGGTGQTSMEGIKSSLGLSASKVAIGNVSGYENQGDLTVAIGNASGYGNQGQQAIAIGYAAGNTSQGDNQ